MFVLGVGAQKAGTTWLHAQLKKSPTFESLGPKELHFWDRLYSLDRDRNLTNIDSDVISLLTCPDSRLWDCLPNGPSEPYFDNISDALMRRSAAHPHGGLVADITPSYAGLPLFVMEELADGLHRAKIDYRVVYLMRDPVARIVSAFAHRTGKGRVVLSPGFSQDDALLAYARSWTCQLRSRYELTIANLQRAFDPKRLFVGFQEKIESRDQETSLTEFLELPLGIFDSEHRVHTRRVEVDFSEEALAGVAKVYQQTYLSTLDRFPEVEDMWSGFRYLT